MSDLATESDGSVVGAAEAINKLYSTPTIETPTEQRPRGPDGKFLPMKPKDDDGPIPMTPQDGSEYPDNPKPKPVEAEEEEVEEEAAEEEQDEDGGEEVPPAKADPKVKLKVGGKVMEVDANEVLVPIKVDGMIREVPLSESSAGYSRTEDYTRKTQALAEERKRFEAEEREPVRQERALYAERLAQLEDAVQSLLPDREPDLAALRNEMTPDQFTQAFADWRAQAQRMEKIRGERARVAQLQEEESGRMREARLTEELKKLQEALPDLADPEKRKVLTADLRAYADSLGFPENALDVVEDHQLIVILNKARLYDQSQLRRPKLEDKVDRVLESVKPNSTKPRPKMSEIERANTRLRESGKVEDAAFLINQLASRRK